LDFIGAKDWTISRILDTVEVHTERHDVPFERLIFADVNIIAHHRTLLVRTTQPEFYGRVRADTRKIDRAMSRSRDPVDAAVERLVENHSHVGMRAGTGQAHQEQHRK